VEFACQRFAEERQRVADRASVRRAHIADRPSSHDMLMSATNPEIIVGFLEILKTSKKSQNHKTQNI
jgi:hypothetical protein